MTETAPLPLLRETLATAVGEVVILTDGDGALRAVDFADFDARMRTLLDRHYGRGGWSLAPRQGAPSAARDALAAYFAGEVAALDRIETRTGGTPFQREVWAALRRIAPGTTASYGAVARDLGRPSAVRAVGAANGANPIALVAPCHRVVGRGGGLTGYAGGLDRKRWLLDHEAKHAGRA